MSSPITIRPLRNAYCQQIVDLILPIQQIEFNVPINLEAQQDLLDIETHYLKTGGGFWGAFAGEELVGTIALMSVGHHAGALRKMFVKKEYRGKELGIATLLLDILLDFCRKAGITDIYLGTVGMLKAAHRFYERNGFKRIDFDNLPDYFPRMLADHIFYTIHLNLPMP